MQFLIQVERSIDITATFSQTQNPLNLLNGERDLPIVKRWLGMIKLKVYRLFYFVKMIITGTICLDMIQ